jgi:hypothetical protein
VFYWLADDPVARLQTLAASQAPFDVWLRSAASSMHPMAIAAVAEIASGNTLVARYPAP